MDEQCSKLLSKFLLFVAVPLTTLLLTLFLVGFILKNTVGKPQFMKLWEENWRKKKDDPTRIDVNLNEYTDFWWILTFAPLGISVIIWYAWMLLFNVKQLWAHVNRVQRSNSSTIIISLPLVLLCTFASFVMCGTLVTLRFTFPYDSESSTENCRYVWLRKMAHNDFVLLVSLAPFMIAVNRMVFHTITHLVQRVCNVVPLVLRILFEVIVDLGVIGLWVGAVLLKGNKKGEESEVPAPDKLYRYLALIPIFLFHFVATGFAMVKLWYSIRPLPYHVRGKLRRSSALLVVLIMIANGLFLSCDLWFIITVQPVLPLTPLTLAPITFCLIFYTMLHMVKVAFMNRSVY